MSFVGIPRYNEFALLPELAASIGLEPHATPSARRVSIDVRNAVEVSGVEWVGGIARVVFLAKPSMSARSLDRLALRLNGPALVLDILQDRLPEGQDRADVLTDALRVLAPEATAIVGIGPSALTAIEVSARATQVQSLVLVDALPPRSRQYGDVWLQLATLSSSYLIRSRNSPVSPSEVNDLRRWAPNTRLIQLAADADDLETVGYEALAQALRTILVLRHYDAAGR